MTSSHFLALEDEVKELRRIYLDQAIASATPTIEDQEHARAFVTFVHAELEWFVEEALRELASLALAGAAAGNFSRTAISMLTFTGLPGAKGGNALAASGKKNPRKLATRIGEAHAKLLTIFDNNMGVREKHVAAMGVPLGLDSAVIDPIWLGDLDAFCSYRGAYVHMGRRTPRASCLAVNPTDMWLKCHGLIWGNAGLSRPGVISSFRDLDDWIENEKVAFGPSVVVPQWRITITSLLLNILQSLKSRGAGQDDDG